MSYSYDGLDGPDYSWEYDHSYGYYSSGKEGKDMGSELAIVEIEVTYFKAGETLNSDDYDVWLESIDDTSDDLKEKRMDQFTCHDDNVQLIKDNVGFKFNYVGQNFDGSCSNGIESEVDASGPSDVFESYLPAILDSAQQLLQDQAFKHRTDVRSFRFLTLWKYSINYSSFDDDCDTDIEYLGRVDVRKLAATLAQGQESPDAALEQPPKQTELEKLLDG